MQKFITYVKCCVSQIRIFRMSFLRINSWGIVTNKIIDSHSPSSRSLFILQFEDFIRARIVADAFATSGPSFGPRYWSMKSNSIPTPNEILFCVTTASGWMFILIFMGTSGRADWPAFESAALRRRCEANEITKIEKFMSHCVEK